MKSLNQLLSDWRGATARMEKLQNDTPRIFGNESVKVVRENFKLQGYDSGSGVNGWEERDEKTNEAYNKRHGVKGSVYNSNNPLLTQTHNLYNSIKYKILNTVVNIGVDLGIIPYAQKMNEGGDGVPARQYIPKEKEGPNPKILRKVLKKITSERGKAMSLFKK